MIKRIQQISTISLAILAMVSCIDSNGPSNSVDGRTDPISSIKKEVPPSELVKSTSGTKYSSNKADLNLPDGYKLFDQLQGDLNGDGVDDDVLIIKGTDKEKIVINRFDKKVDRNRRGLLIYLSNEADNFLATENLECFSSENEDGGVYFPPELSIEITNGKLYIHYGHGRYGSWKYTFRYQDAAFALIGYDSSDNYGPIVNQETSINFLTKKKLIRKNINQQTEESGDEIFEDTWTNIDVERLYKLSEIADFDELVVNR